LLHELFSVILFFESCIWIALGLTLIESGLAVFAILAPILHFWR
jgi:hypothetical protein